MLLDSHVKVQGPYLYALMGQLVEQAGYSGGLEDENFTVVVCYCNAPGSTLKQSQHQHVKSLQETLGVSRCYGLTLEDYNPLTLEKHFEELQPNMVWLWGDSPFSLRYYMRTSGLDRWISQHCGGSFGTSRRHCVFVGEGVGAICAGASLRVAHYPAFISAGKNPHLKTGTGTGTGTAAAAAAAAAAVPPEPQFFGLGLLGSDRTVAFVKDTVAVEDLETLRFAHPDLEEPKLVLLKRDQVYVWSQSTSPVDGSISVASFVFLPLQFGMMEQMTSPEPLPQWADDNNGDGDGDGDGSYKKEGVSCFGEPSIDPSRQMQRIGDSEWLEDFDG